MTEFFTIESAKGRNDALIKLFGKLLDSGNIQGIFALGRTEYSNLPMPTFVSESKDLSELIPLAPVAPFNAAKQATSLLSEESEKPIVLVLKPCELRALVELSKLNQCKIENTYIISMDCQGRLENGDFLNKKKENEALDDVLLSQVGMEELLASSCQSCTEFSPVNADLRICTFVEGDTDQLVIETVSEKGKLLLNPLGLCTKDSIPGEYSQRILEKRSQQKDITTSQISEEIGSINRFMKVIGNCLNCQNCRVACPVCYCKECVFSTSTFFHKPAVYFNRSQKKGRVKLPTETTMFHMTRLAHIGHSCVACGHCSNVCPSDIPVADFFRVVSSKTQALFDYKPGYNKSARIPYLEFEGQTEKSQT